MRLPKVGDTIIWRDSDGTPRNVVVERIENYAMYFQSPWVDISQQYVQYDWLGDETMGWDWASPEEAAMEQDERIEALLSQVDELKKSLALLKRGGCPGCPDCLSEANKAPWGDRA